jgi:hypothetical protein
MQNYHLGELCPQDIKDAKVPPAPPGAIEAREFFRQRIKRSGAREKTLLAIEEFDDQCRVYASDIPDGDGLYALSRFFGNRNDSREVSKRTPRLVDVAFRRPSREIH